MRKTVKINEVDKKLYKAIGKAIDKKAAKEIVPIVKEVYKTHAKKDLAKMKAKPTAVGVDNEAISDMRKKISSQFASYAENTIPQDGKFIVFNKLEPNNPLWGQTTLSAPSGDIFAEWIVDGDLVIHPALTQYNNKHIDDWKKYTKYYRIEANPYIDEAIKEIRSEHWDQITQIVRSAIEDEITRYFK